MISNKLGNLGEAIRCCDEAIRVDDKSLKAYYQKAVAYKTLKNYDEAYTNMKKAVLLNPKDKTLRGEFEVIKELKKKSDVS